MKISQRVIIVVTLCAILLPMAACAETITIPPGEVEATEYLGVQLTPISRQLTNALAGAQTIDKDTYRLAVDGLVDNPLSLSYADLEAYPQITKLTDLDCVEGWYFTAKWTGPALNAIFDDAKVKPEARIAIFHTADVPQGYSSLDVSYIHDKNIIIALKLNDITMPVSRGFPFQVVAESKFGYKWSKWVTRIELSNDPNFLGYWEGWGYNNNADVNGPNMEVTNYGPLTVDITTGSADFIIPDIVLSHRVTFSFTVTGAPVSYTVYDPKNNMISVGGEANDVQSGEGSFHALDFGNYKVHFVSSGGAPSQVTVYYTVNFE